MVGTAIGDMQKLGAGLALEQLDCQMGDAAGPGRAAGDLAGIGLGVGDEALEIADAELGVDNEHLLDAHHQHLRRQVLGRVVGHLGHQALHDGAGRRAHQAHDVRIAARLGDEVDAGDAGGAALVLDQHRLAKTGRHALGEIAAENIGRPAGREGHDKGERLTGKSRLGVRARQGQGGEAAQRGAASDAQNFLPFVAPTVRKDGTVYNRHPDRSEAEWRDLVFVFVEHMRRSLHSASLSLPRGFQDLSQEALYAGRRRPLRRVQRPALGQPDLSLGAQHDLGQRIGYVDDEKVRPRGELGRWQNAPFALHN
jgi:hypothetical protein